jgi:hypothetical protein
VGLLDGSKGIGKEKDGWEVLSKLSDYIFGIYEMDLDGCWIINCKYGDESMSISSSKKSILCYSQSSIFVYNYRAQSTRSLIFKSLAVSSRSSSFHPGIQPHTEHPDSIDNTLGYISVRLQLSISCWAIAVFRRCKGQSSIFP